MGNSNQCETSDAVSACVDSPIIDYLHDLREQFARLDEGEVADYIPELAKASSDSFGIAVATTEDHGAIKVKLLVNMLQLFSRNLRKANTEIGVLS